MTVVLDTLPEELARSVRAARRGRASTASKPFAPKGLDPVIGEWAQSLIASRSSSTTAPSSSSCPARRPSTSLGLALTDSRPRSSGLPTLESDLDRTG